MKHNFAGRQRFYQYDLLRVLLVVFVVIGHATFTTIQTKYGHIDYGVKLLESGMNYSLFHRIVTNISDWIYTFHMPVFIALSGTIYSLQKNNGAYVDSRPFLIIKANRLVIPLIVVWWLYRFPIMFLRAFIMACQLVWLFFKCLRQVVSIFGI